MALTYYIRSWDPRSTYPTNPQEGDICYTITLDQTWAPVGGVKDDNILKKEVYQNGAWVEQGGGGGGELTTADVNVVVNGLGQTACEVPIAYTENGMFMSVPRTQLLANTTTELVVILYKGYAIFTLYADEAIYHVGSVSGEAQLMDNFVMISGDCTITLEEE